MRPPAMPRGARGFSLIELLISLGLFSVVLAMVLTFLEQARRNLESESSSIETQQGARVSVEELSFHVRQAGYGIERSDPDDPASWQRAVIWAGAHGFAFNADIDPERGAIDSSVTLRFLDGTEYAGEAASEDVEGAETYYYTIDADGNGEISPADRSAAESGSFNPAARTDNPLDYALVRRVYGWAGEDAPLSKTEPVTAYLFTNANPTDLYGDGTRPDPLFAYWLTEDLDGDGSLAAHECVVPPCPASREPKIYLWGDSDFDGVLSDDEKDELRELAVGDPDWEPNPLVASGLWPSSTLAAAIAVGESSVRIADVTGFFPGAHLTLGEGASSERATVASIDTSTSPAQVVLAVPARFAHAAGQPIEVRADTLLRAIRSVQVRFGAITPRRDDDADGDAVIGRAHRTGTRGLAYRVLPFERRLALLNLRTRPASRS